MTVMKMWKVIDIEIFALPHESLFLVFQENRTMIFRFSLNKPPDYNMN